METKDKLLTKEEVAEHLSISVQTVSQLMKDGKLKYVQVSPKLARFERSAIENYKQGNTSS